MTPSSFHHLENDWETLLRQSNIMDNSVLVRSRSGLKWTTGRPRQSNKCRSKNKEKKPCGELEKHDPREAWSLSRFKVDPHQTALFSAFVSFRTKRPVASDSGSTPLRPVKSEAVVNDSERTRHSQDAPRDATEQSRSERPEAKPVGRDLTLQHIPGSEANRCVKKQVYRTLYVKSTTYLHTIWTLSNFHYHAGKQKHAAFFPLRY